MAWERINLGGIYAYVEHETNYIKEYNPQEYEKIIGGMLIVATAQRAEEKAECSRRKPLNFTMDGNTNKIYLYEMQQRLNKAAAEKNIF